MKHYLLTALATIFLCSGFASAQQHPPSPQEAYRLPQLSPRPIRTAGVQHNAISLNGRWHFSGGKYNNQNINVPGEWEMQGFSVDSAAPVQYTRTFEVPADWKNKRIKLRFDGVSSHCVIKVNGKEVGTHEGSFVPFEVDITHAATTGTNQLEVIVRCQTLSDVLACTSQYAGHPVGGILRKVILFALPPVHLTTFTYVTEFDNSYSDARLQIPFALVNTTADVARATIRFKLQDANGKKVSLPAAELSLPAISAGASKKDTVSLAVTRPEKWNPEHPYRYTLITELSVDGAITETYVQKIGFREVQVRGNQLLVNGHPVKLHGVCRHSISPFTGRSVPADLCIKDAALFRKGNCNYIRTSHYPAEEAFLNACDSLGLFVESESSLCWIGHGAAPIWKKWDYTDRKFLPAMVQANLEKMIADRNHPSVICWSLGNESRWSPLWAEINKIVKGLDPSRPTVFQDQCWGTYNNANSQCDIANYHYPHFEAAAACDTMKRPVQFDEYAHVENYNRREVLTDPYVRSDWGPSLSRIYDSMYIHPGCLGGAIWAGIDDIFHMPDSSMIGYGPWGVIDGWRRKKPEFWAMKKAYAPVIVKHIRHPRIANGQLHLQIENRYDFTNLSDLRITYRYGDTWQTVTADVAPHQSGTLAIPLPDQPQQDSVILIFTDPRGFIAQQVGIRLTSPENALPETRFISKLKLKQLSDHYVVENKQLTYLIDKETGLIETAKRAGQTILQSAPALMIVPLNDDDGGGAGITNCNYQRQIKPLLYQPCQDWKADKVTVMKEADGSVRLRTTGAYREASGSFDIRFEPDGDLQVTYHFTVRDSIQINPRQWGLVFVLPDSFDRLSWKRKGYRTAYAAEDISRINGTAQARPASYENALTWSQPDHPWYQDANKLGSNDFRSTKGNIYQATLTDRQGRGLKIQSDGSQSVRSWIDGRRILLLAADYNTGGSDRFSSFFYAAERRPLKAGDAIDGTVLLQLSERFKKQTP